MVIDWTPSRKVYLVPLVLFALGVASGILASIVASNLLTELGPYLVAAAVGITILIFFRRVARNPDEFGN